MREIDSVKIPSNKTIVEANTLQHCNVYAGNDETIKTSNREPSLTYVRYGSTPTACKVVGRSRSTLLRWVASGLIPRPIRLGGSSHSLWDIPELLEAIASNAKKGA